MHASKYELTREQYYHGQYRYKLTNIFGWLCHRPFHVCIVHENLQMQMIIVRKLIGITRLLIYQNEENKQYLVRCLDYLGG